VVNALQALRGVSFITAVALVSELGDLTRFGHPRELMAYLGLVPSSGAAPCRAASVNNRSSVGSVGGFARNNSFCSSTDIEVILALTTARALRIICTASNTFVVELLIAEDLPG
jgi:hypothetical protein